jgi:GNAT superfamily N-acetyltransferase
MALINTIQLDKDLFLVPVQPEDHLHLLRLMRRIYLPVYHHLWKDSGDWYLEKTYSEENLAKELSDNLGQYYFVIQGNKPVGIFRIRKASPLIDFASEPAVKLHRIYLDPSAQGQGIGKKIVDWALIQVRQVGAQILWLEAMDTQKSTLEFYEAQGFEICGHFTFETNNIRPEYSGMVRMYKRVD